MPQTIETETRVFVVAGEVVTLIAYRRGGIVTYSADRVDEEVLTFAAECVASWQPNDAFVAFAS